MLSPLDVSFRNTHRPLKEADHRLADRCCHQCCLSHTNVNTHNFYTPRLVDVSPCLSGPFQYAHTLLLCAVCHSHSITPVFPYICKSHTSKHDSPQHLRRHSPSPSSLYTQHGNPGSNLVQVELMKLITGALISPHPNQGTAPPRDAPTPLQHTRPSHLRHPTLRCVHVRFPALNTACPMASE